MKNKYYIPEITELHPGMEIELFYQKGKHDYSKTISIEDGGDGLPEFIPLEDKKSWHKHKVSETKDDDFWAYPIVVYAEHIDNKVLRIKKLSINDIKSLHWIKDPITDINIYIGYISERGQNVRLIHKEDSNHILIYCMTSYTESQTVFAGQALNISELKVIIKQLRIKPHVESNKKD